MERSGWSARVEAGYETQEIGLALHLVNERVFIPSTQRRWGVGGGGLCLCKAGWHWPFLDHAVSAPTGYMDRALCWANKAVVHASPFKHGPDGHV
jgi:hypothetical protein